MLFSTILRPVPSISTIDYGEADCTIKPSSSGSAAPCLHAQTHWRRRCQWWLRTQSAAQAPSGRSLSILDCKARAPPCQLAECPNSKRAASAAKIPVS